MCYVYISGHYLTGNIAPKLSETICTSSRSGVYCQVVPTTLRRIWNLIYILFYVYFPLLLSSFNPLLNYLTKYKPQFVNNFQQYNTFQKAFLTEKLVLFYRIFRFGPGYHSFSPHLYSAEDSGIFVVVLWLRRVANSENPT